VVKIVEVDKKVVSVVCATGGAGELVVELLEIWIASVLVATISEDDEDEEVPITLEDVVVVELKDTSVLEVEVVELVDSTVLEVEVLELVDSVVLVLRRLELVVELVVEVEAEAEEDGLVLVADMLALEERDVVEVVEGTLMVVEVVVDGEVDCWCSCWTGLWWVSW
jgi:hypothetical protein